MENLVGVHGAVDIAGDGCWLDLRVVDIESGFSSVTEG